MSKGPKKRDDTVRKSPQHAEALCRLAHTTLSRKEFFKGRNKGRKGLRRFKQVHRRYLGEVYRLAVHLIHVDAETKRQSQVAEQKRLRALREKWE